MNRTRTRGRRAALPGAAMLAALILASTGLTGCASVRHLLGLGLVPLETEVELGDKLAAQIESEHRVLRNRLVQRYVRSLAQPLIAEAVRERSGIDYRVTVLDDPDQVNAFALPGGRTYVFTGLMILAEDESELASVLAHELAHVVARHSAEQLATSLGVQTLAEIVLGENPAALLGAAQSVLSGGVMLRFSRDDEREADDLGLRYAAAAGYDPHGMVRMFERLKSAGGGGGGPLGGLLSTHPGTDERIARLQKMIDKMEGELPDRRKKAHYWLMTAPLRL